MRAFLFLKTLVFSPLLFSVAFANPVMLRVYGANKAVLFQQTVDARGGTLGGLSDQVLRNALAARALSDYQGSESGVVSINHLGNALEVLSNTEMNAYGWCYWVDGKSSDLLTDQYQLTGREQVVEWVYSYAHLNRTVWTSMCTPASHIPPQE